MFRALAISLCAVLLIAAAPPEVEARALSERLLAPCCFKQTLDVHASDAADALRAEIRARLERGESVATIEADLVARHGARIRAVPHAGFLDPVAWALYGAVAAALVLIFFAARRRARRSLRAEPQAPPAESAAARDQLARELDELD